jgi:hypothetical protein
LNFGSSARLFVILPFFTPEAGVFSPEYLTTP